MWRLFWLNDAPWAAIAPHLPPVHTGPRCVDDRRVISGIVHRLREGCRWHALPPEYGPYTTVFNRCNRGGRRPIHNPPASHAIPKNHCAFGSIPLQDRPNGSRVSGCYRKISGHEGIHRYAAPAWPLNSPGRRP
ncbi:transposase [Roseomonas terrae]|uniref:Transposase n=1 Tax=Neoroseomonas terrae TaxID=424799 RepID=A0ABS5EH47_9PROT|nr:transposase [Neoroseomonas terrae]